VAEPALDCGLQCEIAHAVRQQKDAIARRARLGDDRLQIGEETHCVQAGLAGHRLVLVVIIPRQRKGDQLAERRPAERDDRRIGVANAGFRKPFAVEGGAGDRVLEAVVETVDEDQEVASRVGQIVDRRLAEAAGRDVLDLLDCAGLVGGQIGVVDKRGRIGDRARVGRRDNARPVVGHILGRAGQRAVRREIDCRQHVAPLLLRGRA
jgi:hypothetical protein